MSPIDVLCQSALQVGLALAYYAALVVMMRVAGKRLAGQTTTFDLLVLITLGVVLQSTLLREGKLNAAIFVGSVLAAHLGLARACSRWRALGRALRGEPRTLVIDGVVDREALAKEKLSYDDLLAGLRKLGHAGPEVVRLATLEETGHISAIPRDPPRTG